MCEICGDPLAELAGSGIYSACKVGNAIDLHKWSKAVLGPKVEPPSELHCTVAYSTKHFDVTRVPDFKPIKLGKNTNRRIGRLGDMVVLFLDEEEARPVKKIWKAFIDQGASWSYGSYVCHISLAKSSNLTDAELAGLRAYEGPILLMPPYIDSLKGEEFEVDEDSIRYATTAQIKALGETSAVQFLSATAKKSKIKEIKALITKYEKTSSDNVANKLKKQIYTELEETGITREEVGLPPAKVKATVKRKESDKLPKLTENEKKMLVSVYNCYYGENGDDIWAWAHNESRKPHNLSKVTASGVIASLVKKKLMHSFNDKKREDDTCGLTSKGQDVAGVLDKEMGDNNPVMPKPVPKAKPVPGPMNRDSVIQEIKSLIKKYEKTTSDAVADRTQKKIYELMEEWKITRPEVGLPEKKAKTPAKSVEKKTPLQSTLPLKRLPATPFSQATNGNKTVRLRYLKELWHILNDEKFGNQMKLPRLDFLKSMKIENGRLRGLGVWVAGSRRLAINPNLFNNEPALYETFLHEMCHQAVHEISKLGYQEKQGGHGPVWASWMVKVGLNPNRYAKIEDITDYMTPAQKAEYEHKQEQKSKAIATETRITNPRTGMAAKFLSSESGIWKAGLVGLPNDKAGKRWAIIGLNDPPNRWTIVPVNMMYTVDEATTKMLQTRLADRLQTIMGYQEERKARRSQSRSPRWDDPRW